MNRKKILTLLLIILIPRYTVNAANVTATIEVSHDNIIKGNSGTATLTLKSDGRISITEGTFSCGELGDQDLNWSAQSLEQAQNTKTFSIKWKANTIGTHTCKVTGLNVGLANDPSAGMINITAPSKTITVVGNTTNNNPENKKNNSSSQNNTNGTTAEKKEYDSDNTLKSLEVENYKITPSFNKDITEYKLEVDESIEKINVKAATNSEKAEIVGTGEKTITSGENTIEVKAIAENGNEKIYKILVTVKDQHPIVLTLDNKRYTVIKKNNNELEKLEGFEEEIIKIKEQDVVSYINKTTKIRVVILKDENNKVDYYIYNEQTKEYTKYKTIEVGNITLQLLNVPISPKRYKKYQIDINNEKIDIYKIKDSHKIGLIYGTNVKTGNTGFYVYDEDEETLSRYYDEEVKVLNNELLDFQNKAMIFMGVISGIVIIIIMISLIKKRKRKNRINK